MASVLKLKTDIKKLKAAIASKATSGAIKTKLRGKLTSLENELDKLQPNKRKPKTTGPKNESALVRLAKKRRTNQGLSTSKSDIERDAIRPAKKAGKRISASGNTYYEYRDNRIDNRQPPRKYRKLASGGSVDYKLEVINQYSDEKLARIYSQMNDLDYSEILSEIKGDPEERNEIAFKIFKEVVERDNEMADGGKTQGYDDKKDESLGMTRGKLSLKDFVGNRKQKEHSRRDDARFEERGKMADGGGVDKYLTENEYIKIEKKLDELYGKNVDKNYIHIYDLWAAYTELPEKDHESPFYKETEMVEALVNTFEEHGWNVDMPHGRYNVKEGYKFKGGGYMAKGGKTKDQEVVRGYFEDEAYEYGKGGKTKSFTELVYIDKDGSKKVVAKFLDKNEAYVTANHLNTTMYKNGKLGSYKVTENTTSKFKDGGYMAKGGKTKDQEVVRGYFEDEAYEYAQGGNLRFNNVSIHISKNTEEDMRNAGFTFDPKGNAPLYYNGKEVGYLSNFNGVMLNDEYVDELVPMFNTFRDAGIWNYRGWKEEAEARKRQYGNKMADGGKLKSKYVDGDMVYSYQNKDYAAPVNYVRFSPWKSDGSSDPKDTYKYRLTLKDGNSNWINEESLFKTKQEKYASGGYMADGGSVAKGNYEMLMSQAKEVMHHAEELMQVVKPNMDIEAWVVSKAERATTDLSDITHYLDGLKMAMGGMVKHNAHKVNG